MEIRDGQATGNGGEDGKRLVGVAVEDVGVKVPHEVAEITVDERHMAHAGKVEHRISD